MNWGRVAIVAILLAAAGAGGGIWYAQEYAYYDRLDPASITLAVMADGRPIVLEAADVQGIDGNSSPLRWRACARLTGALPADSQPFADPKPAYGPRWFPCFDADRIGTDLESGAATAYLAQPDIHPDVDRVLAVYPDGRVYGWHQYNDKTPERGVMD